MFYSWWSSWCHFLGGLLLVAVLTRIARSFSFKIPISVSQGEKNLLNTILKIPQIPPPQISGSYLGLAHSIFLLILKGLSFVLCTWLEAERRVVFLNTIRNWAEQSRSSNWWLVDRMPWNVVGLQPRIQHFVFVCFWETVVWCYCDRKWESWEWGNREGWCLCGSPVKSLCPWRAALLQSPTEKRAAFVYLMGLRASSYSEGLEGVRSDCGLLHLSTWVI